MTNWSNRSGRCGSAAVLGSRADVVRPTPSIRLLSISDRRSLFCSGCSMQPVCQIKKRECSDERCTLSHLHRCRSSPRVHAKVITSSACVRRARKYTDSGTRAAGFDVDPWSSAVVTTCDGVRWLLSCAGSCTVWGIWCAGSYCVLLDVVHQLCGLISFETELVGTVVQCLLPVRQPSRLHLGSDGEQRAVASAYLDGFGELCQ